MSNSIPPDSKPTPAPAETVPEDSPPTSLMDLQRVMQDVTVLETMLLPPVEITPHTSTGPIFLMTQKFAKYCNRKIDAAIFRQMTVDDILRTCRAGFAVVASVVARHDSLPDIVNNAPRIHPES